MMPMVQNDHDNGPLTYVFSTSADTVGCGLGHLVVNWTTRPTRRNVQDVVEVEHVASGPKQKYIPPA